MPDIPPQYEVIIYQQNGASAWGSKEANEANSGINVVRAWMPTEFQYQANSDYEPPFQKAFGNETFSNILSAFGQKLVTPVMTAQLWQGSSHPEFSIQLQFETDSDPLKEVREPILKLIKMATPYVNNMQLLESPGPYLDPAALSTVIDSTMNAVKSAGSGLVTNLANIGQTYNLISADTAKSALDKAAEWGGKTINTENEASTQKAESNMAVNQLIGVGGVSSIRNQIAMSIGRYLYFPSIVITNVNCNFLHQIELGTGFPMSVSVDLSFKPMFLPTQQDIDTMFGA